MYHASHIDLTGALRPGLFSVTDDAGAAVEYLEGEAGYLHTVQLPEGSLADRATVAEVAREIAPDSPYTYPYEQVEEVAGVVEALQARGYIGIAIDDTTPDNATAHRTITLFDGSTATIVAVEEVSE